MKIKELISNNTFEFNVDFRVYNYIPSANSSEEGEMVLKYDSRWSFDIKPSILEEDITAINQSSKGIVEIEYI